jgi:hypothetical protein
MVNQSLRYCVLPRIPSHNWYVLWISLRLSARFQTRQVGYAQEPCNALALLFLLLLTWLSLSHANSSSSSVGIPMGCELDGWGSILPESKTFHFSQASRQALGPTQFPTNWPTEPPSPGVNRPGIEADNSPLCSTEDKNGGCNIFTHHRAPWAHTQLIKHKDKFTFTLKNVLTSVE